MSTEIEEEETNQIGISIGESFVGGLFGGLSMLGCVCVLVARKGANPLPLAIMSVYALCYATYHFSQRVPPTYVPYVSVPPCLSRIQLPSSKDTLLLQNESPTLAHIG